MSSQPEINQDVENNYVIIIIKSNIKHKMSYKLSNIPISKIFAI